MRVSMKTVFIGILFILASATAMFAQAGSPNAAYDRIPADKTKRFLYPYYLYVPDELKGPEARKSTHTLLVIPNNTGRISDDFSVHEADAMRRMEQVPSMVGGLKVAVLMPVFPRSERDWKIYTHGLDRDVLLTNKPEYHRLDLQLLAMIDDARGRLARDHQLKFERQVLLNGFSAQAMFANRFTFLHPDRVKAAAIGAPGGWPIAPVAVYHDTSLRYPIGVADFRQVTGRDVNMRELRRVPLLIFMGDRDDNDAVPYGDAYENEDREVILPLFGSTPIERWAAAKTFYSQAGLNAEFKLYPGVGHTVTNEMRQDVRAFLQKYAG
jgi:pimeloyl-ACP methyl ester carboxylesterase